MLQLDMDYANGIIAPSSTTPYFSVKHWQLMIYKGSKNFFANKNNRFTNKGDFKC
jgi:hypothetical protein